MPRVNWDLVEKGDMGLAHGYKLGSYSIRRYSAKTLKKQGIEFEGKVWSNHAWIYAPVQDINGNIGRFFVEAVGRRGVVASPFSKYQHARNIRIFTFKDEVYGDRKKLKYFWGERKQQMIHDFVEYALTMHGLKYDYKQIIGMFLNAIAPDGLEIIWDNQWRMICSELVGKSALQAGFPPFFDLNTVRKAHLVPEHIILSPLTRERTEVYI